MEKIRILLADDHPILREGLRAVLETQPDFEAIAEAANGHQAMRLALALQPDILLLDLEMPQLDGVETIRSLRQQQPHSRIIVFTAFDNDERIIHAVQAGANGYLLKEAPRDELFSAIRITMAGGPSYNRSWPQNRCATWDTSPWQALMPGRTAIALIILCPTSLLPNASLRY